jgi:hypothetical protein
MSSRYHGVQFFAERTRKNGKLAGTVLILSRAVQNGQCFAAIGVPRGDRVGLPVVTWVSPRYLADYCLEVSEEQARSIDPNIFVHVDAFETSPEYRERYSRAVRAGASPLQPALRRDFPQTTNIAQKFYEIYGG